MEEVLIPNESQHDVSTFDILIDGNALSSSYEIMSIAISKEINKIPYATIVIRDGDASERSFKVSEEDVFIPGKKILINIGRDGDNEQAFKGIITRHAIRVRENGNGELQVECRDESVKMTIGRKNRYYENIKDSQLFDDLISRYPGLSVDPETTSLQHKELVQHHLTDWDFMLLRAEANGMLVMVNDGAISIKRPDTSAATALQVAYGSSVLEFEGEIDARSQWKNVEATSWDYANQELFKADTSSAAFSETGNLNGESLAEAINLDKYVMHHSGRRPEQELQDWVNGIMLRSRMAKVRGRVKFTGFARVKPGDMVQLDGVGARFNGKVYVTAVRQEVANGTWDTHIQFGLDPMRYAFTHKDICDAPSAGLSGCMSGLQIGKVVQLQNDPDGEHRILVRIPVIDNAAQGIWTRVASLDAGNERGAFFMPEIGDEVIVGFINDDPRDAVVLGMLHSSNKPAPITAADVNHEKGFTTRSKMHISFNDDTKTIVIDTPAGNSITLDEKGTKVEIKDQNQNSITMDSQGIRLESQKNIEIKAGLNLTLGAQASLSIGGATLSCKADGNLNLEGALAKLKASGITEVSGSLVKIN